MVHQLLTRFVDDEVFSEVTVEDITAFDKSFVSDEFLDRESDVIYRVSTGGRDVYIYVLIEFQSTVDKPIPIRMLHYILGLYDQFYRTSEAGKLPAVFPILLYNGNERWTVPKNVRELIEPAIAERYIPSFEYYPIIEQDIADETLERIHGVLAAVMYLDKRRDATELRTAIDRVIDLLAGEKPEQFRMFGIWLTRMFRGAASEQQFDRIRELREVRPMLSDVVDQIENRGKEKGLQEGFQKGRQEGSNDGRRSDALRMLRKGYPTDDVVDITELSHEEVTELAKQFEREKE